MNDFNLKGQVYLHKAPFANLNIHVFTINLNTELQRMDVHDKTEYVWHFNASIPRQIGSMCCIKWPFPVRGIMVT